MKVYLKTFSKIYSYQKIRKTLIPQNLYKMNYDSNNIFFNENVLKIDQIPKLITRARAI